MITRTVRTLLAVVALFVAVSISGCVSSPYRSQMPRTWSDSGKVSPWARESVSRVGGDGLYVGYPDGTFKPGWHQTREEGAIVADRLNRKMEFGFGYFADRVNELWWVLIPTLIIALAALLLHLFRRQCPPAPTPPAPAPTPAPLPAPVYYYPQQPAPYCGPSNRTQYGGSYPPPAKPHHCDGGDYREKTRQYDCGHGNGRSSNGNDRTRYNGGMPNDAIHKNALRQLVAGKQTDQGSNRTILGHILNLAKEVGIGQGRLDEHGKQLAALPARFDSHTNAVGDLRGRHEELAGTVRGHGRRLDAQDLRNQVVDGRLDRHDQWQVQATAELDEALGNLNAVSANMDRAAEAQQWAAEAKQARMAHARGGR